MEPHIIEEREIPKSYLFKSPSETKPMGFLDRFEVRSSARDFSLLENLRDEDRICDDDSEMVGIECQDDMMLYFTGFLVLPSDASAFRSEDDSSILEKPENRNYYLMCSPSRMWSFDYSEDLKGVWFENDNGWYKLLNPSKKYAPIYEPFKKKCDLWLTLHDTLQFNFSATFSQVMVLLKGKYTEKDILDNAQFIFTNSANATTEKSAKKFSSSNFIVELRKKITEMSSKHSKNTEKKQAKVKTEPAKKRERIESEEPPKKQKIKKSSKSNTLINPILLTTLYKAKEMWKREAEEGELSDSGDRNIVIDSQTKCDFCKKHRHEFIACARCEEYQLCSVCFKNLKMGDQVKPKYLKNGKTAFDYCGENSMFTCRPCFDKGESDTSSEGSFNLDDDS